MDEIDSFDKPVPKRLCKIEKDWEKFSIFYFVKGTPSTNNLLENYYSPSLKTQRKKALRTERGINNHIKLSKMKRAGLIINSGKTILQMFQNSHHSLTMIKTKKISLYFYYNSQVYTHKHKI